jgi:hypothetical protein
VCRARKERSCQRIEKRDLGPALGGFAIAFFHSATPAYALNTVVGLFITFLMVALLWPEMRRRRTPDHRQLNRAILSQGGAVLC